jgi:hypothetical protein
VPKSRFEEQWATFAKEAKYQIRRARIVDV